jgi:iron complex outermembrane receptor protein
MQESTIPRVRDLKRPATTVKEWMAQVEAATVQVTKVKLEPTETGLDITLETAEGKPLQIDATKFRREGNSLIADIPNATLALPQGQTFVADNPTADIATVQVVQQDGTIRISVTGKDALPKQEVMLKTGAFSYSLNPEDEATEEELVVTGERETGYFVPDATTATKTDTPIRDIPQTIQVIPQQVLRDQNVTRLQDATRNVAGASQDSNSITDRNQGVRVRGFYTDIFRNGLRVQEAGELIDLANVERIEVLSGPASVLYGRGFSGGIVNVVTKQPLRDPFYAVDVTIGSFDFYRGAIDLSGPLNDSKTVLYRLNVAYLDRNTFVDRFDESQFFIAPVVSLVLGDRTRLTLESEYIDTRGSFFFGLPIEGTVLPNPNGRIPRNRNTSESDLNRSLTSIGYRLEHQFNDNWSLQHVFRASFFEYEQSGVFPSGGLNSDNRTIERTANDFNSNGQAYRLNTYLTGKFSTGSIKHQVVFGVDLDKLNGLFNGQGFSGTASPIDVFNPVYGQPTGTLTLFTDTKSSLDSLGFYVQDQVTLARNLKLLLGGRFDLVRQTSKDFLANTEFSNSSNAFTPRVGIVYQPISAISLYASYATSFNPVSGTDFEGNQFQPERGTQYEVGVKADLNDQLSATLAFYDLTLSNVLTVDTANPNFSTQVGEQQSRGFDLTLQGEILPGWSIIAGYAYINAKVTQDNSLPVGSGFGNVPQNSFNLWTKYEFQSGALQGFGVGLGLFYVGDRPGFFDNTYELPSYLRTDAALYYQRDRFRVALNFRNLFNITYFESSYGRGRIFYGEPFAVQGTISWEF